MFWAGAGEWFSAEHKSRDAGLQAQAPLNSIIIDYPGDGSIFPPEFPPPTFIWRDSTPQATSWLIEVTFADHSPHLRMRSPGEPMRLGEIDPRCVGPTNELPKLSREQAEAHTWTPEAGIWSTIKQHSMKHPALVTVSGLNEDQAGKRVSQGQMTLQISKDPVGAPVFYRDVPLMPSEQQKGIIKPLAPSAVPLIAWRLRNIGETRSRLLMEGLHSCANCHSFSRDGKTLGMDVDGPANDKGLYALASVQPQMSIGNPDVIQWSSHRGNLGGRLRVGFMSQVSPDGNYVLTTINDPGTESREHLGDVQGKYFVTNFKDYRFLQVFYPTRGILAWYDRKAGYLQPLPGADDPRFVQTGGVWSPDGKYIVYARAEAKDPYPPGGIMPERANDPNETQIQYDLYRIPFNQGKGGKPERIAGASQNGMSNNFPKVSSDGRWIVFVQCRNAQLMRPDSQLYIVPFKGGAARRMQCNTALMNSWHSISPNGRWMVFSSKSRSPYTQLYLTHLDKKGQDSPAILIENTTASNRAVNIPEFVNIPPDGLMKIDFPATELYTWMDLARESASKKQYEAAALQWRKALELSPNDASIENSLGVALARTGKFEEAISYFEKALRTNSEDAKTLINLAGALNEKGRFAEAIGHSQKALTLSPEDPEAHANLAMALAGTGKVDEAISHFEMALEASPDSGVIHQNLGFALLTKQRPAEALPHLEKALEADPGSIALYIYLGGVLAEMKRYGEAVSIFDKGLSVDPNSIQLQYNLGRVLAETGKYNEAVPHFEQVVKLSGGNDPRSLDLLGAIYFKAGRSAEAIQTARRALALAVQGSDRNLTDLLRSHLAAYETAVSKSSNQ